MKASMIGTSQPAKFTIHRASVTPWGSHPKSWAAEWTGLTVSTPMTSLPTSRQGAPTWACSERPDGPCLSHGRIDRRYHRRKAPPQRIAPAHGRSYRVVGAADGNLGSAARHQFVARRAEACVRGDAAERDAHLRSQGRHTAKI